MRYKQAARSLEAEANLEDSHLLLTSGISCVVYTEYATTSVTALESLVCFLTCVGVLIKLS